MDALAAILNFHYIRNTFKKIRKQGDVEKYLHNGVYIKTLFPDDIVLDTIYGDGNILQKYKK